METDQNVIEIERKFDVDVKSLYAAWTEGEHLKKWWHPMGESITDVKNELKEGGAVEYIIGDAGLTITGTYSEVVPEEKLVYSWIWSMSDEGSESGYTLHITFSGDGEGSTLHVLQEGFSGPDFLPPHQQGWEKGLDDLAAYLSGGDDQATTEDAPTETSSETTGQGNTEDAVGSGDRSGGYNESPEQAKVGGG